MNGDGECLIEYTEDSRRIPFSKRQFELLMADLKLDVPSIVFDVDYMEFIQRFNGGIPKKCCFNDSRGHGRMVEYFMYFSDLPRDAGLRDVHVTVAHTQASDSEAFRPDLIPFAELFAGDMLCFDHSVNPQQPSIVIWLHEESEIDAPAVEHIANSFREFCEMLYEPDESD
ncbi:MAG: hypothetical protein CMJ78_08510 [Planctomycetaceae bacterium]|nr:hypothetical protein [Planctomycetaceae bacterium]